MKEYKEIKVEKKQPPERYQVVCFFFNFVGMVFELRVFVLAKKGL
jgi:hypothetical protein